MKFADIPGHDDLKARLIDMAASGRLPHAILLEGSSGRGKFMLARALAQYIHCEHPTPTDSCGCCPSCLQHESFNHIDTIYSYPVIKKSGKPTISADYLPEFKDYVCQSPFMDVHLWLEALDSGNTQPKIYVDEGAELTRRLNFRAHQSRYKIVLLWLPEKMNEDTANKMLKLIEEPHPDTIFIMTANESQRILPTIYSRTQRIPVDRYSQSQIRHYLSGNMSVSDNDAETLSRIADGNINTAIALTKISGTRKLYLDLFIDLMRKAYQRKIIALRQWSTDVAALGREMSMAFLDYCAHMMRENFILNLRVGDLNCLTPEEQAFSANFSRFINERNVLRLFDIVNQARNDIAGNANARIVFFDVAVKTILLLKA